VKEMRDSEAVMIKVTPHGGDYSTDTHKERMRKKGKGGGWKASAEGKDEKGYQRAQGSGSWKHYDTPTTTAKESGQPKEYQDQQDQGMQQMAEPAPWQQGKGKQQVATKGMRDTKPAPWSTGKGNQSTQPLNQGAQGTYQLGMVSQYGTPASQASWNQGHFPMITQQGMAAQQKGKKGQNMVQASTTWGQQSAPIQANMGKQEGAPQLPLAWDLKYGPPTWLIGQWHPYFNTDWEVTSWYLVQKNQPCDWPSSDGSYPIAEHIHGDSEVNHRWYEQFVASQVDNEGLLLWDMNYKGKGKV
jgi:hypothetical protein